MKMIFRVLCCLLPLFAGAALTAQEEPLSLEFGSTLYRNSRPFVAADADVLQERLKPFYHGVASGDPLHDRVIIWTRVTPDTLDQREIEVTWRVATDPALRQPIKTGTFLTSAERDYTVKVDVIGLSPGTTYYYGFRALEANSLTGRTKTTPTGDAVDHLKFGVVSCSNYEAGYFNAYGHLAARNDLDAVLHLGDYIYEYARPREAQDTVDKVRTLDEEIEVVDLFEYRARYSAYRLDTQLIHVHQQHPLITVWDDHEYANNSYADGAGGHQPNNEGTWQARKAQAKRAYFEWLPIRDPGDRGIYRTIHYGRLADLIMLDTRIEAREAQIYDVTDPALQAEDRTLLGGPQKTWLKEQLLQSTAKWKIVGQQVMFSPFAIGWAGLAIDRTYNETENMFLDTWAGYPAERAEMMDFFADNELEDLVVLSGSFHASVSYEVTPTPITLSFIEVPGYGNIPKYSPSPTYDPETARGAVAVEFVTPSITSANFDELIGPESAAQLSDQVNQPIRPNPLIDLGNPNPHMKYVDLLSHGYFLLDVDQAGVQADYYYSDILKEGDPQRFDASLTSGEGTHRLVLGDRPAPPKETQDIPAPADPPLLSTPVEESVVVRVLSVFPNPVAESLYVQYSLEESGHTRLRLLDGTGRLLVSLGERDQSAGLYTYGVDVKFLPAGTYFLEISSGPGRAVQRIVRQ